MNRRILSTCMPLLLAVAVGPILAGCVQHAVRPSGTSALDTRPVVKPPGKWAPPLPEVFELSNGITVWYLRQPGLPLFALTVLLPYGTALDPENQAGLGALASDMLDEGTETYTALQLSDEIEMLGATLVPTQGRDSCGINLEVLERNLEPALRLVLEIVSKPRFDPKEFERVRNLMLSHLKRLRDEPDWIAQVAIDRAFYGDRHPYARSARVSEHTLSAITLDDIRAFHRRHWHPGRAAIVATGNVETPRLRELLQASLGSWKGAAGEPPPVVHPPPRKPGKRQLVIVDKPGAPQTVIEIAMPGFGRRIGNHGHLEMVNTILGGSFTSRLMQNLREDKGFTYGAYSYFGCGDGIGNFGAGSSVQSEVTAKALAEFLRELGRLAEGDITTEEVDRARATLRNDLVGRFESRASLVFWLLRDLVRYGLAPDEPRRNLEQHAASGAETLNELARKIFRSNDLTVVLVGDKKTILPQLEGLGLPTPNYRDVNGNPVDEK